MPSIDATFATAARLAHEPLHKRYERLMREADVAVAERTLEEVEMGSLGGEAFDRRLERMRPEAREVLKGMLVKVREETAGALEEKLGALRGLRGVVLGELEGEVGKGGEEKGKGRENGKGKGGHEAPSEADLEAAREHIRRLDEGTSADVLAGELKGMSTAATVELERLLEKRCKIEGK